MMRMKLVTNIKYQLSYSMIRQALTYLVYSTRLLALSFTTQVDFEIER